MPAPDTAPYLQARPPGWPRVRPPRVLALAALALLVATAGCTGGGDPDDTQDPGPPEADGEPANGTALEAPSWSLGDSWTYRGADGDELTWAVTGDAGSDWIVDTTDRELAFFDARDDVSWLGEVRKDDLAGSQDGDRVRFFEWPLEPGKTWTTPWDGVQREVTVDRVEDGTAHLTARQDGRVAVEYTYNADVGNAGRFTFYDENGTTLYDLELVDSGSEIGEPAVRWSLRTGVDLEGSFGTEPASEGIEFEVPEGATDLWLDLRIDCPSGTYDFGFGGNETGYRNQDACPAEVDETGPVAEDPSPGSYEGGFAASSPGGEGSYRALLLVRTLEEVPVGEG